MYLCVNTNMNVWTKTTLLSAAALLSAMACTTVEPEPGLKSLESFRWENRILFVFIGEKNRQEIINQLSEDNLLVEDRDMVWFVGDSNQLETNFAGSLDGTFAQTMTEKYQTDSDDSLEVVLIGKDGGVKYRADQLNADEIYFEVIDVMPMRRTEMREGS